MAEKKRIEDLRLAGNFRLKKVYRLVLVEFGSGKRQLRHLYNIGNNKDYQFENKFEFDAV